jgi:hypothetical protein
VPSTTKIRRNININSRDIKYDNNVRQAIRNIIYDLKYKNIVPSLNTILKQVNGDPQLPNFSLMTLRRLLFDMGFCYEKSGNKSILVEKPLIPTKKDAKKENLSAKVAKKSLKVQPQNSPQLNMNEQVNNMDRINKPIPQIPQNNVVMPHNQPHPVNTQQNHRLLPMHVSQHDNNHMIPSMHIPHHNMPMMLNHRMPAAHPMPPPNMNMHLKSDMPPWMHHPPHAMMKQE